MESFLAQFEILKRFIGQAVFLQCITDIDISFVRGNNSKWSA